ncbi:hypothetical protein YC2023_047677 [Brassica napus]
MDALGGFWGLNGFNHRRKKNNSSGDRRNQRKSGSSDSVDVSRDAAGYHFPLKQAVTAGALTFTGDTIAQLSGRWKKRAAALKQSSSDKPDQEELWNLFSEHDWVRALRMSTYGFLLYGPGSYAWYQYLDRSLPKPTATNIVLKVLLNQVILGPSVIAVIFAWNNLWLGKISELGNKYQKDALPTLLYGFRFWVPVSILNFWVVPLQARVAFMSMGSVFWNFYLSSTLSKLTAFVKYVLSVPPSPPQLPIPSATKVTPLSPNELGTYGSGDKVAKYEESMKAINNDAWETLAMQQELLYLDMYES